MFLHLGPGDGFCLVSPLLTNVTEHSGNFVIAQGAFERGHHALVSLTFYLHRALQPVVNNSDRNIAGCHHPLAAGERWKGSWHTLAISLMAGCTLGIEHGFSVDATAAFAASTADVYLRSEERRAGKECTAA